MTTRDDLLGDTERPYGDGLCAVPDCPTEIGLGVLMCRPHWRRVPRGMAMAVLNAWRRWNDDECDLGELRGAQHAAVDAVVGPGKP